MPTARPARQDERRDALVDAAIARLEADGPSALQARTLTAEVGASTQAIYTLFGGMPGLVDAIVAAGAVRLADHVREVPLTDDTVADFFAQGAAYTEWAFTNPQLYRVMFGLAGGGIRLHWRLQLPGEGRMDFKEGREAFGVMIGSLDRVRESGRISAGVDTIQAAGQFTSATHGYVLLEIGGVFGRMGEGIEILIELGKNLMIGLGDEPLRTEASMQAGLDARVRATARR